MVLFEIILFIFYGSFSWLDKFNFSFIFALFYFNNPISLY